MKTRSKNLILASFVLVAAFTAAFGQGPERGPAVTPLKLPASNAGEIAGNIKAGKTISLSWAERSSVACFPGTRFEMFNGNHVLYRVAMPARSRITVTLTPKDGKLINLYALRQAANEVAAPPAISSAVSCEAKYPIYANVGGGRTVTNKDDGTRKIEFISVGAPYSILIGVAGANGLTEGDFTLAVKVDGR